MINYEFVTGAVVAVGMFFTMRAQLAAVIRRLDALVVSFDLHRDKTAKDNAEVSERVAVLEATRQFQRGA